MGCAPSVFAIQWTPFMGSNAPLVTLSISLFALKGYTYGMGYSDKGHHIWDLSGYLSLQPVDKCPL